ncbi:putative equilibrative nucleoside transporter [Medicago truncatula]|nr:putative equilibrative nucleoside transporter [Medicago truncatula]
MLVLIAMYNAWDLVGRYVPLIKSLKMESRKLITGSVCARFVLIPAFYFAAKYGTQGWMIMLTSFFEFLCHESPPTDLLNLLRSDAAGAFYLRV